MKNIYKSAAHSVGFETLGLNGTQQWASQGPAPVSSTRGSALVFCSVELAPVRSNTLCSDELE